MLEEEAPELFCGYYLFHCCPTAQLLCYKSQGCLLPRLRVLVVDKWTLIAWCSADVLEKPWAGGRKRGVATQKINYVSTSNMCPPPQLNCGRLSEQHCCLDCVIVFQELVQTVLPGVSIGQGCLMCLCSGKTSRSEIKHSGYPGVLEKTGKKIREDSLKQDS